MTKKLRQNLNILRTKRAFSCQKLSQTLECAFNKKEVTVKTWCKVCTKHKNKLISSLKGKAIQSLKAFTCETNVTKHQVSTQFIYFRVDIIL